jgi:hypothetical protein
MKTRPPMTPATTPTTRTTDLPAAKCPCRAAGTGRGHAVEALLAFVRFIAFAVSELK